MKREKLIKKYTGWADFGEYGGKIYDVDVITKAIKNLNIFERLNPYAVGTAVLETFAEMAPNVFESK